MSRLTPAGQQIERALEQGFDIAAFNLYYANLGDDVPMTTDKWPEWHRMIQGRIGDATLVGQDVAAGIADEDERENFLLEMEEFEPSVVEVTARNPLGEIVGFRLAANPDLTATEEKQNG